MRTVPANNMEVKRQNRSNTLRCLLQCDRISQPELAQKLSLSWPTVLQNVKELSALGLDKELTFKTVFRYRHIYPMAIEAVAAGKINLKGIVTDIFNFDDIQNAMDRSVADKANIVKTVVKIVKD